MCGYVPQLCSGGCLVVLIRCVVVFLGLCGYVP